MPHENRNRRTTAEERVTIWADGKRRVAVAQPARVVVGRQVLQYAPDQVIEDGNLIALLEEHGIALVELHGDDNSPQARLAREEAEAARLIERIHAIANVLEILPATLEEALFKGGFAAKRAVLTQIENHPLQVKYKRLHQLATELAKGTDTPAPAFKTVQEFFADAERRVAEERLAAEAAA